MNESEYQHLRETSWRRPLSGDEEARLESYLALHPEAQSDWELESGLTGFLGQLPDAPMPSNFTAQTLQAVEREMAAAPRGMPFWERLEQWVHRAFPRVAWACIVTALAFVGYHQYQAYSRDEMEKALIQFTKAADLKDPGIFKDLEAIRRVGQMPPPADEDLWLALNQPSQ
jgi:hypothetical protein